MKTIARLLALAALLSFAPCAIAAAPDIPNQPWYPEGYLDLRIAAAEQVKTFPRDPRIVLFESFDDPAVKTYDVIDCNLGYDLPEQDRRTSELSLLALDVARMRAELAQHGYRKEIYDQALLDYEAGVLRAVAAGRAVYAPDYENPGEDDIDLFGSEGPLAHLAAVMEAKRAELQPRKPRIVIEGGCGAGEEPFTIALQPANGEVWLINAFAFRVCERKVTDPWNHRACGWTQYSQGDDTWASGRYMYEARWPDGTVKRGAKVLEGDGSGEGSSVITFRRN